MPQQHLQGYADRNMSGADSASGCLTLTCTTSTRRSISHVIFSHLFDAFSQTFISVFECCSLEDSEERGPEYEGSQRLA